MKTTVELPEELLREAMRLSGLPTKRAAILAALEEFVRRRRRQKLLSMLGRTEIALTQDELERMRQGDGDGEGRPKLAAPPR